MTFASLILTAFIWSAAFVLARQLALQHDPRLLAVARFAVASVLFLPVLLRSQERPLWPRVKRHFPRLLFLGLTGITLYNLCFFWGVRFAPASDGGLISPVLNPIVTVLLARPLFGERLGKGGVVGVLLTLCGEALLFFNAWHVGTGTERLLGDLLFVGGALCWSAYSLMLRGLRHDFDPIELAALAAWIGCVFLLPFGAMATGWEAALRSPDFWLQTLFLAAAGTVIAFFLYATAVARIGAGRTAMVLNMIPVMTVLLAAYFLQEEITRLQVAGMVLVVLGVTVVTQTHRVVVD